MKIVLYAICGVEDNPVLGSVHIRFASYWGQFPGADGGRALPNDLLLEFPRNLDLRILKFLDPLVYFFELEFFALCKPGRLVDPLDPAPAGLGVRHDSGRYRPRSTNVEDIVGKNYRIEDARHNGPIFLGSRTQ